MRDLEALARSVQASGGKMTAQRALIFRALQGDTSHPTAEALHERLLPDLPHLSLTTVYKTLNELVAWGDLRRLDVGDGKVHFDPDAREHAEVVCLHCRRIADLPSGDVESPLPTCIGDFQIVRRRETFFGYCASCQSNGHNDADTASLDR